MSTLTSWAKRYPLAAVALVVLLVLAIARWARAAGKGASWTSSDESGGYPNDTHWSPHFSRAEVGDLPGYDDVYTRTARYLEHLRELRGGLPFTANIDPRNAKFVTVATFPLPGQSVDQWAQLVSDTVTADAAAAGLDFTMTSQGENGMVPVAFPRALLGL